MDTENLPLQISMKVPSVPELVSVVRLAVSGLANRLNFTVEEIEDIKICVSEACTNVVQHAYAKSTRPQDNMIDVVFTVSDESLGIQVQDFGEGFDVSVLETMKTGVLREDSLNLGLGLTFVRNLMDECDVHSEPGKGTVVSMKKRVPQQTLQTTS
ncbi:MAG: hypothetical protein CL521_05040 [Actinobacteria bacterium]|nr:hypothetical protein [Actinomycetota bacterium]